MRSLAAAPAGPAIRPWLSANAASIMAGNKIQLLGPAVSVLIDAVSFLGSAIFVGFIRKREDKPERYRRLYAKAATRVQGQ